MKQDYSPFSVALIDVFASALGVFMIFSVISLPYIFNTDKKVEEEREVSVESSVTSNIISEDTTKDLLEIIKKLKEENSEIKNELEKRKGLSRKLYGHDFKMELPIIFDGNQWYIRPEAKSILDMMGRELAATDVNVKIVGHTSGTPRERRVCHNLDDKGHVDTKERSVEIAPIGQAFKQCFNDAEWRRFLSTNRADSIKNYLIENYSINPMRIESYGVGSDEPLERLGSDDSRNRRVEVIYSSEEKE